MYKYYMYKLRVYYQVFTQSDKLVVKVRSSVRYVTFLGKLKITNAKRPCIHYGLKIVI